MISFIHKTEYKSLEYNIPISSICYTSKDEFNNRYDAPIIVYKVHLINISDITISKDTYDKINEELKKLK